MNQLKGMIIDVNASDAISLIGVDVEGDRFSALVLEGKLSAQPYEINQRVTMLFKETEVGIGKNLSGMMSLRNRFKGTITSVDQGAILTKVTIAYKTFCIQSIIATQSALHMELKVHDAIEWLVKSNEVTLMQSCV